MPGKSAFLDTNVLIYLYSDDAKKRSIAIQAIEEHQCVVSTQVLNEFCTVGIRKLGASSEEVASRLVEIGAECTVTTVKLPTIRLALQISEKYQFSYFDSLVVASALEAECDYLFTEDLSHNQMIDDQLTIKNIFLV